MTVTLNPNQLKAHLRPIADLEEIDEITLVADEAAPAQPKLRTVVPPAWLVRVLGRAGAKLVVVLVVALRERPDWILAYNLVPHALNAMLVGALTRRPTYIHLIGGPREWTGGGWTSDNKVLGRMTRPVAVLERILVWAIRRATVVAVMGSDARRDLIGRGVRPERVVPLPAAIDDRLFELPRAERPRYDLVTASQLIPRKRLEDLLAATAILKARHPELRVAIAGSGGLEDELRADARRQGLESSVDFLGFVSDIGSLYADSAIFVLPSRSEGLSIALCEAMAAGLPVVATDVGEVRDVVIPGETGELYAVGDVEALATQLDRMLGDRERRLAMGRAASAAVRAHCSRSRITAINHRLLTGGA